MTPEPFFGCHAPPEEAALFGSLPETLTGGPRKCPVCAAVVPVAARGRPRVFCSDACRRVAHNAIRRAERAHERLVDKLATVAANGAWSDEVRSRKAAGLRAELALAADEIDAVIRKYAPTPEGAPPCP